MAEGFTPGLLKDLKVVLKNADNTRQANITNITLQISITEDIFKNTLYGSMRIRDASDLLGGSAGGFAIIGEEFVEIDYSVDWRPAPVPVKLRFAVYNISDIEYMQNNTKKEYTLHFCSEEHLIDATTVVMKGYTSPHSDNVKNLLEDYLQINKENVPFPGKRVKLINYLETTKGIQNVVIPRLPPIQAAQFLARRSISDSNFESGTYLFFENFKGFNFCDVEFLIKKGIEKARGNAGTIKGDYLYYYENPLVDTKQTNPREVFTIIRAAHKSYFDTILKLKNGMFESDMIIYDYVNQKAIPSRFRFLNDDTKTNNKSLALGNLNEKSFPENSITFMNSVTSKDDKEVKYSRFFVIPKDTSPATNDTFLDIIYPARASYFTRLAQNMFTLDVYGNPNINAGDAVYINVPEGNPQPSHSSHVNRFTAGYYLVCTINHILTQTTYQAKWDVYRNAFSSKVDTTDEAVATKVTGTDGKSLIDDYEENQDSASALPEDDQQVVPFLRSILS